MAGIGPPEAHGTVTTMVTEHPQGRPAFIPPGWYESLEYAVTEQLVSAWLTGPTGCGKTTAVERLAAARGKRLFSWQAHSDSTVEEVRGQQGLRDGSTFFQDGPLVRAVREGGWLVAEEVNLCRPGVVTYLNTVLDDTRLIVIPETGEELRVPDDFLAFFCVNECGYSGTRQMNAALKDRCRVIECNYLPPETEAKALRLRLRERYGVEIARIDAQRVAETAELIREARSRGSVDFDLSFRTLVLWADDAYRRTQCLERSFRDVVLPKVGDPTDSGPQRDTLLEIARVRLDAGESSRKWAAVV